MKALVLHDIGKIEYEQNEKIPEISEGEVLVHVRAVGVCGSDIPRIYTTGAHKMPLIVGHEFSGEVKKVLPGDEEYLGKRVGIFPLIPCMKCESCTKKEYQTCENYDYLGSRRNGGFAEYVSVPKWNLICLPENISYEEAAMIEPMAVAVGAIKKTSLETMEDKTKKTALVIGQGTIGQFVTMFLKEKGIKKVIVIGNKKIQKKVAKSFGVEENEFVDEKKEDVYKKVMEVTAGKGADYVFECVGKNATISDAIKLSGKNAEIIYIGNPEGNITIDKKVFWDILRKQITIKGTWNSNYFGPKDKKTISDDWDYVIKKMEEKKIDPQKVITKRCCLETLEESLEIMKNKSEENIKIMCRID